MYIEIPELGFFGTLGKLFTITGLIKLVNVLLAKPILSIIAVVIPVIITIVLLVIVRVLRTKMNGIFSEFWYKILK
jgi:energy-converting hydrogenase Eha subunit B